MRDRLTSFVLLPAVLLAVGVLAYFTFRTTLQLEKLRSQSVLEATLALAIEKADRLDKRLVEEDNTVLSVADPWSTGELESRWLPIAQRQTPTVRAILVLDETRQVLAFASRAGGAWSDEEAFRRLLVHRMWTDMDLERQPLDELRHLHRAYAGQSYLLSYWQRSVKERRYLIVAWHDMGRIVRDLLPTLAAPRLNVVDEDGRIVYGPPLRTGGEFTVAVRFPSTLYAWRVQVSPTGSDELALRLQNRRLLEMAMVVLSALVILAGIVIILVAAEKERRASALKSDFVANVSHELKTPLALVRMFGEMLQSGRVASEEKRKEYLDIIVRESERLSALIENVLDFARVERGRTAYEFEQGDVGAAVARAVSAYQYRAECEGVDVLVDVEPGLPARLDERAVQLAVINLLDNAIKYAPGSGAVRVKAARRGDAAEVSVTDRGRGIAGDERLRIFERFVRGRDHGNTVRGSGIGLALVKHIAVSHGGRAWVESEVGAGSTFVFTIPLEAPRMEGDH